MFGRSWLGAAVAAAFVLGASCRARDQVPQRPRQQREMSYGGGARGNSVGATGRPSEYEQPRGGRASDADQPRR